MMQLFESLKTYQWRIQRGPGGMGHALLEAHVRWADELLKEKGQAHHVSK